MKTVGIIGGIGPESTIEYYRLIISAYRERTQDGSYPSILINSIDMKRMLDLIGSDQLEELTRYLLSEIEKLARAGADFAALASNTPHIVFDSLQGLAPIPLVSIVEAACNTTQFLGLRKVGLFGTRFTMQGPFYSKVFSGHGIAVSLPRLDEQEYIHSKYMGELVNGVFLPETRDRLLAIAKRLQDHEGIQGLVLGGTELPLILTEAAYNGMPFLDTTAIHVKELVAQLLA
jgi:aspartate racemase